MADVANVSVRGVLGLGHQAQAYEGVSGILGQENWQQSKINTGQQAM